MQHNLPPPAVIASSQYLRVIESSQSRVTSSCYATARPLPSMTYLYFSSITKLILRRNCYSSSATASLTSSPSFVGSITFSGPTGTRSRDQPRDGPRYLCFPCFLPTTFLVERSTSTTRIWRNVSISVSRINNSLPRAHCRRLSHPELY